MENTNYFGAESHEGRSKAVRGNAAMKKEYDFSKGERGKFYRPGVELNIPVYLDPDVAKAVRARARKADATVGTVVNEWLRKDMRSATRARKAKAR